MLRPGYMIYRQEQSYLPTHSCTSTIGDNPIYHAQESGLSNMGHPHWCVDGDNIQFAKLFLGPSARGKYQKTISKGLLASCTLAIDRPGHIMPICL